MPSSVMLSTSPMNSRHMSLIWTLRGPALAFLILALVACSGGEGLPVGKAFRGDALIVGFEDVKRASEIRYLGLDQKHYLVVPSSLDNELVAIRLNVYNERATKVLIDVSEKTGELRGFGHDEKYGVLDVTPANEVNVKIVETSHPNEDLFVPFISGSMELLQEFSVVGWIVFEVPKGLKLREMRWESGGDVIFIRS